MLWHGEVVRCFGLAQDRGFLLLLAVLPSYSKVAVSLAFVRLVGLEFVGVLFGGVVLPRPLEFGRLCGLLAVTSVEDVS